MPDLEVAIEAVRAVRDCETVRRLCLDCWTWAQRHGERAGVLMARDLLRSVQRYVAAEAAIEKKR